MSWWGGGEISSTPGCVRQTRDLGRHLVAGELSALTRLRALCDLDLELLSEGEVLGRDAEASRGDLLDARVRLRPEARWILAALARVRPCGEAVERDRDSLMGLCGERAVGHPAAREASDDRRGRLDLVEGNRIVDGPELEQVAERVRSGGFLQRLHDGGTRRVRLAALAELHVAGVLELRRLATLNELAFELGEADAADRARCTGETGLDDVPRKPDGLEELRAAIRRDLRNPHLGHDLQDAVLDGFTESELRLGRRRMIGAQLVFGGQRRDCLEREARADGVGAVPEQACKVVGLADFVADHDDRGAGAETSRNEVLVHGADGEHRGDPYLVTQCYLLIRCPWFRGDTALFRGPADQVTLCYLVVEDNDVPVGLRGFLGEAPACAPQAFAFVEGRVEHRAAPRELGNRRRKKKEAFELEQPRRSRMLADEWRPRAEQRAQRHDRSLTQMVDRRVRHLREPVPQVRRDRTGASGERRQRGVVSH